MGYSVVDLFCGAGGLSKGFGLPNFNGESPNSNGEHLWGVSHRKN